MARLPATRHSDPWGFQPDVFATAPGDDDYTPLRKLIMVTWTDESEARGLNSAKQVADAERSGEVQLDDPGPGRQYPTFDLARRPSIAG
ncbi:MAG: hypothetical protein KY393_02310 [Actinobacteria bacterium]|nr:hypothetical protein [Actinomycetota bacterium]